jgi:vancomycin permeability regulator SanA
MAINGYMLWVDGRYVKTPEEWKDDVRENDVECIFVLGCSVNPDQSPSAALKSRLDRAAELYKMSPHKILVSGDHSEDGYYNEVKVMKQYLIDWGIPSEDIYVDHYGFSTYDSIYRAYNTFGIRRMTIVTEEFHIYRSIFLARSFGMEADGVASKEQSENNWSLREIIARDKDFLSSVFRPDPEKTGDTISLTGSGDDTNER